MKTPSKLICGLAELSRAIDIENPEYKSRPQNEVSLYSQWVYGSVVQLEAEKEELELTLDAAFQCVIDLHEQLKKDNASQQSLDILEQLFTTLEPDGIDAILSKVTPEELAQVMDEIAEQYI